MDLEQNPEPQRSAEKILGGRAFPAHSPEPGAGLGGEKRTQVCPCVRTRQDVGESGDAPGHGKDPLGPLQSTGPLG